MIGATLVDIRPMTAEEMEAEGWDDWEVVAALVFSDGSVIYPSQDGEGNGPGVLFGRNGDEQFYVTQGGGE